MKNKIFSLMAVVLFMSSSFNVAAFANGSHETACRNYAKTYSKRIAHMQILSEADERRVYNVLYSNCMNQ